MKDGEIMLLNYVHMIAKKIHHNLCVYIYRPAICHYEDHMAGLYMYNVVNTLIIIIHILTPGVVYPSNCALPMPDTADGVVVSPCQVLVHTLNPGY